MVEPVSLMHLHFHTLWGKFQPPAPKTLSLAALLQVALAESPSPLTMR